ncbi:MAG: transglycosylase domain-containing protein [Anaerolineae bacterium]|nr:transglycosylase domain-containing protein [Anaerolineae bacterium]
MASVTQIIQRRRRRQARQASRQRRLYTWIFASVLAFAVLVVLPTVVTVGGAGLMYWRAAGLLPQPQDTIYFESSTGPTELYDRNGGTLLFSIEDPLGSERTWATLDSLPDYVVQATLLMEDSDFLTATRPGTVQTFTRLWQNVITGPVSADTSITGRLVRNVIAPPGETPTVFDREREIALVSAINQRYTPTEILEWHLNTNYYGNEAYGIEAAARVYLDKSALDLSLDEAALLVAIPTAPQYNPFDNEVAARGRQDDVLRLMLQAGEISTLDYDLAVSTQTPVQTSLTVASIAPEFSAFARRQAVDILNSLGRDGARLVARGGLRITTTLDLDLYYEMECVMRTQLARLRGDNSPQTRQDGAACAAAEYLPIERDQAVTSPPDTGAAMVMDVKTGEIKSMLGPVVPVRYQPGPVLQPFVYFEGFLRGGRTAADMVLDIPYPFPGAVEGLIYTPENPDREYRGPLNLREAMAAGLLPPAVQIANRQRLDNVLLRAHQLGLNSLDANSRYDLSLLERGGEVSLMDITYAYSVLSSMGEIRGVATEPIARNYRVRNPVAVLKIEDDAGDLLWQYGGDQYEPDCAVAADSCTLVYPQEVGYLMNNILSDQVARARVLGTEVSSALDIARPAAVVNGLTSDDQDNWTVGYTPNLVTGVHLGRADESALALDAFGLYGAAPIWRAVMRYAHERDNLGDFDWERPPEIVDTLVCERSGLLPNGVCPVRNEIFITDFQPTRQDTYWQEYEINSQTGQLATVNTPAELRSARAYFVPPDEALDWWEANNQPLPPTEVDTVSRPDVLGTTSILQPPAFAYVGGQVDVRGTVDTDQMQYYQLAYGRGLQPEEWVQIGEPQPELPTGGALGTWDTSGLDGLYSLRLSVVMNDNTLETDVRQVTIDNTPPVMELTAGEPGKIYRWPTERVIDLQADVEDNLAIDRVDFYYNGQFIGTDAEWPYGFEWDITRVGTETFTAFAYDQVGNEISAEVSVDVVRTGS